MQMLSLSAGNCNSAECAGVGCSAVSSFEGTSGRKCCDCSADARARTEAHKSGFTNAPHYYGDFIPSRHAIARGIGLPVRVSYLGKSLRNRPAILNRRDAKRTTPHFRRTPRRTERRVAAEERFILPRSARDSAAMPPNPVRGATAATVWCQASQLAA